jgi:hypothetical protein
MQMSWRLEIQGLEGLPPTLRTLHAGLVMSYGGTLHADERGGTFPTYRKAELCARTLYCRLGIRAQPVPEMVGGRLALAEP